MLKKLSLTAKLGLGFGSLLCLLLLLAVSSYYYTLLLVDASHKIQSRTEEKALLTQLQSDMREQSLAVHDYVLTGMDEALQRDDKNQRSLATDMDALARIVVIQEDQGRLQIIREGQTQLRSVADQEIEYRRAGKAKDAIRVGFSPASSAIRSSYAQAVDEFIAHIDALQAQAQQAQHAVESTAKTMAWILVLAGMAVGLFLAITTVRPILANVADMLSMIQEIAANNLAVADVQVASHDEIGQASVALNQMKNSLREIVQSIAGTAEHVANASEEISSSAALQSQSATTQKDQAGQVATAMQEMFSTVLQVAEHSSKAQEASQQAAETARRGGGIVKETLSAPRHHGEFAHPGGRGDHAGSPGSRRV